jgi:hypothetical protein
LTVGSTDKIVFGSSDSTGIYRTNSNNDLTMQNWANASILIDSDNNDTNRYFMIGNDSQDAGTAKKIAKFDEGGDISFYEDTGTTQALFWDASEERLGIGTTSPSEPLHISHASAGNAALRIDNTGDDVRAAFFSGTGYFGINALNVANTATKNIILASNGANVGIGTDSPFSNARLQVNTGTNLNLAVQTGTTETSGMKINAFNDAGSANIPLELNGSVMLLKTGETEAIRIDSSGNVGIGESNPQELLHLTATTPVFRMQGGSRTYQQYVSGTNFIIRDVTATANRITLDSSGNVGIGTDSPNQMLELSANNGAGAINVLRFNDSDTAVAGGQTTGRIEFAENDGANTTVSAFLEVETVATAGGGIMTFGTGAAGVAASEKMRIDSSGNLLVGTTDTTPFDSSTEQGTVISDGQAQIAGTSTPLYLNRQASDGNIIDFRKDGTTVGSVRSVAGDSIAIGTGDTGLRFADSIKKIHPYDINSGTNSDNILDLGDSNKRFDDIYATNGTIQTSDRNEKQDIEALTDAETRVAVAAKGLLRKFRWQSAVEEKGDDARIHFGIIAQDLQDAFTAEGLDAGDYAMFISSTWTDDDGVEQTRLGVRYSELLAFIIAAI